MGKKKITAENWKDYRFDEAKKLFSVDNLAIYDAGFTHFDEEIGKIIKISSSGIVYVEQVILKEVRRNKIKNPGDWQLGGWIEYNPKKIDEVSGKVVRFFPNLNEYSEKLSIGWSAAKKLGKYNLRLVKVQKNGLVRLTFSPMD